MHLLRPKPLPSALWLRCLQQLHASFRRLLTQRAPKGRAAQAQESVLMLLRARLRLRLRLSEASQSPQGRWGSCCRRTAGYESPPGLA
jgi:hypothetical protein